MEYVCTSLINTYVKNFKKPFKEDKFIEPENKNSQKTNIYPIKNFIPVIKPKKANRKPSPLKLNQDSFDENINDKIDLLNNNINNPNKVLSEKDDLTSSDNSDFSSSQKYNIETENSKKDFSKDDKSSVNKYKNETEEIIL